MMNPNSIRNRSLAGMMLVISCLCLFPDDAAASLGSKLTDGGRFAHRESRSQPSPTDETPRLKFFEKLFGERRERAAPWPVCGNPSGKSAPPPTLTRKPITSPTARSTAIGTTLRCSRDYTSAAADWSRFPLGTKFQIVGEPTVYVIDDCGGALYGTNTIDIYRPNLAAMHAWGTRHVQIKILQRAAKRSS